MSCVAAFLNSTGELIPGIEQDQHYDFKDIEELLRIFDNDSYRSLGQAVYDRALSPVVRFNVLTGSVRSYVSGLSSLDLGTAPAIIRDLRSVLGFFLLDEDYLFDMGQFSSRAFTCHSFGAMVNDGAQYMTLRYTLKTICDHDGPVTNSGWSLNRVKVFHRLDHMANRVLSLVMEDSYTSFQDRLKIGEWYSFADQFELDRLVRVSVLETVRYCEMALKGWRMVLDEIEERIWTAVSKPLIGDYCY